MKSKKIKLLIGLALILFIIANIYIRVVRDDDIGTSNLPPTPTILPSDSDLVNEDGVYMLFDSNDIRIMYSGQEDMYTIGILNPPFPQHRLAAERRFIDLLGITEEEACELKVFVRASEYADPRNSMTNFPLSYCQ